jgi:hypothetical protein
MDVEDIEIENDRRWVTERMEARGVAGRVVLNVRGKGEEESNRPGLG